MPFYEYECSKCRFYVEVLQKISDQPLKKCPSCGKSALKKLISAPVFRLKGAGWYETDFKSDQEGKRNLAGADKDEPATETKSDAKAADGGKGEAKTDAKSDTKSDAKGDGKSESKSDSKAETKSDSKPAASVGGGKGGARSGKQASGSRGKAAPAKSAASKPGAGKSSGKRSAAKSSAKRRRGR